MHSSLEDSKEAGSAKRLSELPDLRHFLNSWPYDPEDNVRIVYSIHGRDIMLVRQPMGLEEYEIDGRPDGQRPYGMESVLDFQIARLALAKHSGTEELFNLTSESCAELFSEAAIYHYRSVNFIRLKDWARAERDIARNLSLLDFVDRYTRNAGDRVRLDVWRPKIMQVSAAASAMTLRERKSYKEALTIVRNTISPSACLENDAPDPGRLIEYVFASLHNPPVEGLASTPNESLFINQGDYWMIRYRGQIAILKATRGLCCLICLLRHPGREIHVGELVAAVLEVPVAAAARLQDAGPILDARAKTEYARRLTELRGELEEADRFNDPERAAKAQQEMDLIADQLAVAAGLGGRNRRAASQTERARSAVTKRIKDAIAKIAEAIPALGRHLATRVKTGYFCSYNPDPDRPVKWKLGF